ncbi:MAG: sodium:solute symporter [Cryomorphaceae bacterium]|nr:MAG: sodium:solute symporter [Cryomorphaceae bacterium]
MSTLDWIVLLGSLAGIVTYGIWKSRQGSATDFLRGDNRIRWWSIGLSIMATQASAITFLSTPGLGYEEGMSFVQFYFGMPIALVLICAFAIPLYFRLKVYTAYEFLENRFDLKTRWLAALLFLVSRGLAAGITIYAPAIVLSKVMTWDLDATIVIIGLVVILYTVVGGSVAVSQTHKLQMAVMMGGMIVALGLIFHYLSPILSPGEAVQVAGKMGKMNIVDLQFDPGSKYNIWSGLIGGCFLALSYFGTDQSQVQRYISGKSMTEMRMGLMFNGVFKIPMQFLILFIGVMTFVFYLFVQPPVFFNQVEVENVRNSAYADELTAVEGRSTALFEEKQALTHQMLAGLRSNNDAEVEQSRRALERLKTREVELNREVVNLITTVNPRAETKSGDYIFITFVTEFLPAGLVGLLLAVIFSGAMSSTSAELNALATTTAVDFYQRKVNREPGERKMLMMSRGFTLAWGLLAVWFAHMASLFENLIELVNILGSLFYGTILGIFLVAIFIKHIRGNAVFIAGILSEAIIITLFLLNKYEIYKMAYLWYNLIGPALVITFSVIIQAMMPGKPELRQG